MKARYTILSLLLFILCCDRMMAQTIQISEFEHKVTDLAASMQPVYDNTGMHCAVIRFYVTDTLFQIKGNLGVLKRETSTNEIKIWVPQGTKRLTVRHDNMFPLVGYEIPIRIEKKNAYHATIVTTERQGDISITNFERHPFMTQRSVLDKSKEPCAKIRFSVPHERIVEIKPDLGVRKKMVSPGDISLYVPQGTAHLTVKSKNKKPLIYTISEPVVAGGVYDAVIDINSPEKPNPTTQLYAAVGYSLMNVKGPSFDLGVRYKHHNAELGAVIGNNRTEDTALHPSLYSFYTYKGRRFQFRYGYDIKLTDYTSIIPMAGVAINYYLGTETEHPATIANRDDLRDAFSTSLTGAIRLELSVNKYIKIHATPEYVGCVKQNVDCALISYYDDTIIKWNTGFNLNVGMAFLLGL